MSSASFKFNSPKEQAAFVQLLSFIPRRQRWVDVKRSDTGNTCHICNSSAAVKSGVVSLDDSSEKEGWDGYSFWICCKSCHDHGWQLPYRVSHRGGMRYWRISPTHKLEERIINDFQVFKFPSVVLINTDTVSITI